MSGADLVTVKERLVHKSINMTMRYSHLTPDHKRMAVEFLRTNHFGSKVDERFIKKFGKIKNFLDKNENADYKLIEYKAILDAPCDVSAIR